MTNRMKRNYKRFVHNATYDLHKHPLSNLSLLIINGLFVKTIWSPIWKLVGNFCDRTMYTETYYNGGTESARANEWWNRILATTESVRNSGSMGKLLVENPTWVRIAMFVLMILVIATMIMQLKAMLVTLFAYYQRVRGDDDYRNPRGRY